MKNPELREYIEQNIIPRYNNFDKAHQREHVLMVIQQSLELAEKLGMDTDMAYTIAAYHDTGLCEGRAPCRCRVASVPRSRCPRH